MLSFSDANNEFFRDYSSLLTSHVLILQVLYRIVSSLFLGLFWLNYSFLLCTFDGYCFFLEFDFFELCHSFVLLCRLTTGFYHLILALLTLFDELFMSACEVVKTRVSPKFERHLIILFLDLLGVVLFVYFYEFMAAFSLMLLILLTVFEMLLTSLERHV